MMRPQDGGVPSQVFKIVHYDRHKQIEHLSGKEGDGEKGMEKGKDKRKMVHVKEGGKGGKWKREENGIYK